MIVSNVTRSRGAAAVAKTAEATRNRRNEERDGTDRAYRFRRRESVPDGIRRISAGRADDAILQLRDHDDHSRETAVHEARKDLKKIRSVLRLVRDGLGDDVYRRENDRYRDAGRELSGIRDAKVRAQTLRSLRERFPGELEEQRLDAIAGSDGGAEQETGSRVGPVERAAVQIEVGRSVIDRWELDGEDWGLIEPGLRRAYRRGRNRLAEVSENPTDEHVHEWRKRTKDLWYALRILAPAKPKAIGRMADEVHDLSDLLGDHHDLAVLLDHSSQQPVTGRAGDLVALGRAIEARQRELLERALRRGKGIYSRKPKAFTKDLRASWRSWR